jgi:hypothetical protein
MSGLVGLSHQFTNMLGSSSSATDDSKHVWRLSNNRGLHPHRSAGLGSSTHLLLPCLSSAGRQLLGGAHEQLPAHVGPMTLEQTWCMFVEGSTAHHYYCCSQISFGEHFSCSQSRIRACWSQRAVPKSLIEPKHATCPNTLVTAAVMTGECRHLLPSLPTPFLPMLV